MSVKKAFVFSTVSGDYAELCGGAAALADESVAVVLGSRAEAEAVAQHCERVIWLGEKKADAMVEDYVPVLEGLIKSENSELVLMPTNMRARCIAGRLSVRLDAAIIPETSSVYSENGKIMAERMLYGGAGNATFRMEKSPTIMLIAPGTFDAKSDRVNGIIEECASEPQPFGIRCREVRRAEVESVDLTKAKRIVSIGRGIGEKSFLSTIDTLARKIGAETACSRPVAEELKWMPVARYVGISGVKVKPDVYIACGISGQVQHMIGANGAKCIIAINKDENAPIMRQCDYGLVGDLNKVVPLLIEQL